MFAVGFDYFVFFKDNLFCRKFKQDMGNLYSYIRKFDNKQRNLFQGLTCAEREALKSGKSNLNNPVYLW